MVRGFTRQSDVDPNISIDDQISRFIKDWEEVLHHPNRLPDREALARRDIKDEQRPYLETSLETRYNVVRSAIESYPLLGILGTLFAMALALSQGGGEAVEAAAVYDISEIIRAFNSAIWSTVWGLIFAVGFLLFNASVENGFERLRENRNMVNDIVQKTKQLKLSLEPPENR
jgi:biopolymer transport protein ExbB/TolQ